jgi:hypothetical protein
MFRHGHYEGGGSRFISTFAYFSLTIQKIFKTQHYIYLSEVSILWNGNICHDLVMGSRNWNLNFGYELASLLSLIKPLCPELMTLNYL